VPEQRAHLARQGKGNKRLKWLFIEAAWTHIRSHRSGRLAKVYRDALRRKRSKSKAIKVVARKLVNIMWAAWASGRPFVPQDESYQRLPSRASSEDKKSFIRQVARLFLL
jgi:hypothetical protein